MSSRRDFKKGLLLGVGLGLPLAILTAVVGYGYVALKKHAVRSGWQMVEAVVAIRPLAPGDTLAVEDLAIRSVPDLFLTGDNVLLEETTSLFTRRLKVPVETGQLIQWDFLEQEADNGTVEAVRPACRPTGAGPHPEPPARTISAVRAALFRALP